MAPPFARQALRPGEGPPRPPLPGGRIEPGLPPPRPHAAGPMPPPWPSPDPPAPNGAAVPDAHMPAPARRPAQRAGGQPGQGPLVESIPRRMRVGVTATAQVRVSRERVDGLILLLMKAKGVSQRPEGLMARALTVRLTTPDGGFWIEAMSQETQWAEAATGGRQKDGHLTWRWSVTPQERGRGKLQLVVTARTVGRDGAVAETAPPDRTIEVTVTGGRLAGLRRWIGVLFTLAVGAVIGRFAGDVWTMAAGILKRVAG
jgi:neural Wiskott-Aldrich syndrome protein